MNVARSWEKPMTQVDTVTNEQDTNGRPHAELGADTAGRWARPAALLAYAAFVLEILFMISPAALYFYSVYGPVLNFLHRTPATTWLTAFFLPHYSTTGNAVLDNLSTVGFVLALVGVLGFSVGFVQIYGAKILGRGAVGGGIYRVIRHPQYTALLVAGLGTVLMWPRFLVLVSFVTMFFVYGALARHEERVCRARFGDAYREIEERTGRFLPRAVERFWPLRLEGTRAGVACGLAVALSVGAGLGLRAWSLERVSAVFRHDLAILSPAQLPAATLQDAVDLVRSDPRVQDMSQAEAKLLAYVLPESWYLADIPAEPHPPGSRGHDTPTDFEPHLFKVLLTAPRTHATDPQGRELVTSTYGRRPLVLAHVDLLRREVTAVDAPVEHVLWGDIPTPLF